MEKENKNPLSGLWTLINAIRKAKTSKNVPNEYMPKTRTGEATPEDITKERINVIGKYVTDDFGGNASYNVAEYNPPQSRTIGETSSKNLKKDFDREYTKSGGTPTQLYYDVAPNGPVKPELIIEGKRPSFIPLSLDNPLFNTENIEYGKQLQKRLNYTPASVKVNTYNLTGNTAQSQLSEDDKKTWILEYNTELLQNAELRSQLNVAKAEMENALTKKQYNEAQKKYNDLAYRIALNNNASTFNLNGQKVNSFPVEYSNLINLAEKEGLNEDIYSKLQEMYDRYGISPQWSTMPWGEKYALDHLYGAGYAYDDVNGNNNTSVGAIGQKISDAINGIFTPRTLNGENNGYFVLSGDRQGVHRHLTQRGDNLLNWKFNEAPKDANNKVMNKPYFKIGESMAWDYSEGKPRVALQTTNNFKYKEHQQNNPLFTNKDLYNDPFKDRDFSTFDSWSQEDKNAIGTWLKEKGFNVEDSSSLSAINYMLKNGTVPYDNESIKSVYTAIDKARQSFINPSEGQKSGANSYYHLPMSQKNEYTSNIFGNSIAGLQMINGKPYTFNQDLYDISSGPLKMFGNGTWYRNINEVPSKIWKQIIKNA